MSSSVWTYLIELTRLPLGVRQFLYSEPLFGIAMGMFAFVLNFHLLDTGLDEIQIGQLTSLHMLVMGASAIPFGLLADRGNRKHVLVAGLLLSGLSLILIGFSSDFNSFVVAQILHALGMSLLISAEIPLLYNYCTSRKEETRTYNMMFAIFTLFTGLGTLLGGLLPEWLPKGETKYEATVYVTGALVLLVGTIRVFLPPDRRVKRILSPIPPSPKPHPSGRRMSMVQFWRNRWDRMPSKNVFLFVGFSFFAGGSFGFLIPYFNVIVKFRMDWPDEWVSALLTVNGFFLFLASFFTPLLLDRWGLRKASYVLLGGTTLMTLLLAVHLPMAGFVLLFLLRNGGYMAAVNLLEGQSLQATKDEERGLHAGMRSVARSAASTMAAFATGYILSMKNYTLPFTLTGILLALSFAYVFFLMIDKLEKELGEGDSSV